MKLIPLLQAAKALGVSRSRLYQLCCQGRVPGAERDAWNRWMVPAETAVLPATKRPGRKMVKIQAVSR